MPGGSKNGTFFPLFPPPRSLSPSFALDWPGQDAPLSAIRATLAELTHLPPAAFKIIHAGAVMKDDNAPLSAYSLTPRSTVVVVGQDNPLPPPPSSSSTSDEQLTIAQIQSELASVRTLTPDVDAFLAAPSAREQARLGELLLQCILRLDAIGPAREWETTRNQRKAAVKEAQELLDSLDVAWTRHTSQSSPPP